MNNGMKYVVIPFLIIMFILGFLVPSLNNAAVSYTSEKLSETLTWLRNNGYLAWASGGLSVGEVPYADSSTTVAGESAFTYDSSTNTLSVDAINTPTGRSATIVVAANDAPDGVKNQADYVCDGTADDVEIQAADAAGARVQLTEGTYNLSTSYIVSDNVTIVGFGRGTTLTGCSPIITVSGVEGVIIANMNLNGASSYAKAIYVETAIRPTIDNVHAYGFTDTAFDIESLTANTDDGGIIANCNAYDNTGIGLALGDSGGNAEYNVISNSSFSHNSVGIKIVSNNNTITGTNCDNNILYGYWITGARNTLIGGTANHNTYNGIIITGGANTNIQGMVVTQNGENGINMGASQSRLTFTGISVYANGQDSAGTYKDSEIVINRGASALVFFTNCLIGDGASAHPNYAIYSRNAALTQFTITNSLINNGALGLVYQPDGMIFTNNMGYVTENYGSSVGTGAEQTIAHGLSFTPDIGQIGIWSDNTSTEAYQSSAPDATNIYVTSDNNSAWHWATIGN